MFSCIVVLLWAAVWYDSSSSTSSLFGRESKVDKCISKYKERSSKVIVSNGERGRWERKRDKRVKKTDILSAPKSGCFFSNNQGFSYS